jgi:HEAT repeat protein
MGIAGPERWLGRIVLLLLVATCGLVGGIIAWPALRSAYYRRQLDSPDASTRLNALNRLSSIVRTEPEIAEALVTALLAEADRGSPQAAQLAEKMAVWSAERSPAVCVALIGRLDGTTPEAFLRIARLLRRAGRWRHPEVGWPDLARRETIRAALPDPETRVSALAALAELGPVIAAHVEDHHAGWLNDASPAVRRAAVRFVSTCLEPEPAAAFLTPVLQDPAPGVRADTVVWLALLGQAPPAGLLNDADPDVRRAAAWGCGRAATQALAGALADVLGREGHTDVRAMVVWAIGRQPRISAATREGLGGAVSAVEDVVAARALLAVGRLGLTERFLEPVLTQLGHDVPARAVAAAVALGRLGDESRHRARVVAVLRDRLVAALREGRGVIAAAICEALADLEDASFAGVFCDISLEIEDQPLLQYVAASSAARLDPQTGATALLSLLDSDADDVCDLAAIGLAQLAAPPLADITMLLTDGDERVRSSAYLALGWRGEAFSIGTTDLRGYLAARTQRGSPSLEEAWKPHGYALCGRLLLGDASARRFLDPFIRNANFPRLGLFASLLRSGDPLPLELLLARKSTIDVDSFLCNARYMNIIATIYPEAPRFAWYEDVALRQWQRERLQDWWAINRWRLRPPADAGREAR